MTLDFGWHVRDAEDKGDSVVFADGGSPSVTLILLQADRRKTNLGALSLQCKISPFTFTEIMDLSQAQEDRLLKVYEIAKALLREFKIFPREGHPEDQQFILDIDEFERGWPSMTLDHLCYLVSGVINLAERQSHIEPPFRAAGFTGNWNRIKQVLMAQVGGVHDEDDGDGDSKRKGSGPKFGDNSKLEGRVEPDQSASSKTGPKRGSKPNALPRGWCRIAHGKGVVPLA